MTDAHRPSTSRRTVCVPRVAFVEMSQAIPWKETPTMRLSSWLDGFRVRLSRNQLRRARRGAASRRQTGCRLSFQPLEERCVPSFSPAVNYPVNVGPQAVATADFNGDGKLDLAVTSGSTTVSVLLGNGNGTFQPAVDYATGSSPRSIAVGDFNGDHKLDIVTANTSDVTVLLGNGDGTFQAPTSIGVGSDPASVAVGDFNADGKMDLGVTSNIYNPGYYGPGWWGGYWGNYYYPGNWYPGYYEGRA